VKIKIDGRTDEFPLYIRFCTGERIRAWADRTKDLVEGVAFADYHNDLGLLGIEFLGPCEVEVEL